MDSSAGVSSINQHTNPASAAPYEDAGCWLLQSMAGDDKDTGRMTNTARCNFYRHGNRWAVRQLARFGRERLADRWGKVTRKRDTTLHMGSISIIGNLLVARSYRRKAASEATEMAWLQLCRYEGRVHCWRRSRRTDLCRMQDGWVNSWVGYYGFGETGKMKLFDRKENDSLQW